MAVPPREVATMPGLGETTGVLGRAARGTGLCTHRHSIVTPEHQPPHVRMRVYRCVCVHVYAGVCMYTGVHARVCTPAWPGQWVLPCVHPGSSQHSCAHPNTELLPAVPTTLEQTPFANSCPTHQAECPPSAHKVWSPDSGEDLHQPHHGSGAAPAGTASRRLDPQPQRRTHAHFCSLTSVDGRTEDPRDTQLRFYRGGN